MKQNLLVISDGNGVDTDFKKWPFYLQILVGDRFNVINKSIIGASNEMMYMQLAEALQEHTIHKAIIQWSRPNRIDVLLDPFWEEQAKADPVYHFNIVESNRRKWWVSSASKNPHIFEYHSKYIKYWQAIQRSQAWMLAASELLKSNDIDFCFALCYNFTFSKPVKNSLLKCPWVWHKPEQGLSEFRMHSKYQSFDTQLPRPHTLIQLDWIDKVLRPSNFIDYSPDIYTQLENSVLESCLK